MKKTLLIPAAFLFLFAACNRSEKKELPADNSFSVNMDAPKEEPYKESSTDNYSNSVAFTEPVVVDDESGSSTLKKVEKQTQMLLKDGRLTIRTEHLEESKQVIDRYLKKLNAYYEAEELIRDESNNFYQLNIRVPAANFEKLLRALENGKDKLESKSIQTTDVTEEYVDTKLRISNKRAYLERYKELVSKAKSVKELLEIEEIIRNLQEEIESREGRLRFLEDQAAFGSLNIKLYTKQEVVTEKPYEQTSAEKMGDSLASGWSGLVAFFLGVLRIWPLIIILVIGGFIGRQYWKRWRA